LRFAVLCDFDGTIVDVDTCVQILEKYCKEDWKLFDEQYEKGEITLEECLQKQFSTVILSRTLALNELQEAVSVRPNFSQLAQFCRENGFPFIVVSAGLDFVIKHFLKLEGWYNLIPIHAPKARLTTNGIKLAFPQQLHNTSINFKDDIVTQHKELGQKVVYIGDGVADYAAAKKSDIPFAIRSSKLAELLKKNKIPHNEIDDFQQILESITQMLDDKRF
jgi:2,3-diketo-5-methylthio-1-phosphopentane phosphatase